MDEIMMYEDLWMDEVLFVNCNPKMSASDSSSFNVPYPEKIDRDAWSTQLVPEFAKLGIVCTWLNEHEMRFSIDPTTDIPRMDVASRAQDSLDAFISGFSAETALKVLSGDYEFIFRDFEDKISENPVRDRFNQFVDKYEKFMKGVGQRFPCEIKHNEHCIAIVANAQIYRIMAGLVWEVVVFDNYDVQQELESMLEFYGGLSGFEPSGFEHNPYTDLGPGHHDMMEPSKSLNDQIGQLQI
ncbi:uncharacterized protein LOC133738048 isoform X1 [Rosa rugosa]|uniref:uncharacterized protein LOC133738048 isoform X1 n=2 Tax=Rosa rugosa TaxID=74645 RepID=UPI002B413131|nr:uncharacterized protein LOC133738048 isoform X1 [Rosa rugosa]